MAMSTTATLESRVSANQSKRGTRPFPITTTLSGMRPFDSSIIISIGFDMQTPIDPQK